jgi:hypothetical protein
MANKWYQVVLCRDATESLTLTVGPVANKEAARQAAFAQYRTCTGWEVDEGSQFNTPYLPDGMNSIEEVDAPAPKPSLLVCLEQLRDCAARMRNSTDDSDWPELDAALEDADAAIAQEKGQHA